MSLLNKCSSAVALLAIDRTYSLIATQKSMHQAISCVASTRCVFVKRRNVVPESCGAMSVIPRSHCVLVVSHCSLTLRRNYCGHSKAYTTIAIRLRYDNDYHEKLTCSFFARVESCRMEAGARYVVVGS